MVILQRLNDMANVIYFFLIGLLIAIALSGCQSLNYQVGDISQQYCMTQNEQIRVLLKATLSKSGVNVGVDYCTIHGFVSGVIE